jgi:hypothetical protein
LSGALAALIRPKKQAAHQPISITAKVKIERTNESRTLKLKGWLPVKRQASGKLRKKLSCQICLKPNVW